MKKLTIRTIEAGTYSIGHHTNNARTEKIVVVSNPSKSEALKEGKKEWRRKFDPAGYFRAYGERIIPA